jgi:hypothetical protein
MTVNTFLARMTAYAVLLSVAVGFSHAVLSLAQPIKVEASETSQAACYEKAKTEAQRIACLSK